MSCHTVRQGCLFNGVSVVGLAGIALPWCEVPALHGHGVRLGMQPVPLKTEKTWLPTYLRQSSLCNPSAIHALLSDKPTRQDPQPGTQGGAPL